MEQKPMGLQVAGTHCHPYHQSLRHVSSYAFKCRFSLYRFFRIHCRFSYLSADDGKNGRIMQDASCSHMEELRPKHFAGCAELKQGRKKARFISY
jgi:hypothetical protein